MLQMIADLILGASAVYHLLMGAACVAGFKFISKATFILYKLQFPNDVDPRLQYAIQPLGAFALWTGAVCGWAFLHRGESWVLGIKLLLAVLFVLRAFFRWKDRELFLKAFGVDWKRSRWNVAFNFILVVLLLASFKGSP